MIALITLLVIAFVAAVSLGVGMRQIYLTAHRSGFTAGRAEGYRAGLSRGHAAGVDQAAALSHRLAESGYALSGGLGDKGECCPGYCQWPSSCPRPTRAEDSTLVP